jgi:hypothetical protein
MLALVALGAGLLASPTAAPGRLIERWDYPRLFKEAELVVIAEPRGSAPTKDEYGDKSWPLEVIGQETTFKVAHTLKGEAGADPVKVLHFKFGAPKKGAKESPIIKNGPGFVVFRTTDMTVDTADRARDRFILPRPQYLLFLKKRDDGRYEPVSGQTDPNLSVREVTPPLADLPGR